MKKEAIIYIILGILILLTLLSFAYFLSIQEPLLGPVLMTLSPPMPQNCSDVEIKELWDYLFYESSNNILIFTNTSSNNICENYLAIKIINESFHLLHGLEFSDGQNSSFLFEAYHGNATSEYINKLSNISDVFNNTGTDFYQIPPILTTYLIQSNRTLAEANTSFLSVFKIFTDPIWFAKNYSILTDYIFEENETIINETVEQLRFLAGKTSANYTVESIIFIEFLILNLTCVSNFTAIVTSCQSNDTYSVWYNDTNSCQTPSQTPPPNETHDCDFNRNGIIGDESAVEDNNLDVEIYIDSSHLNLTESYTGIKRVEIREGSITRVEFDYDFNVPLNLRNITIEKQSSGSNFGYIIVSGIPFEKTLIIDKLNSSSSEVCIRNREVSGVSEFSSDCDLSSETLLSCPGSTGQFTCDLSNNKFVVSGLTSSAVKEIIATTTNVVVCTPSWQCTSFGACVDNQQTRVCTDLNNCGTNVGKPAEIQACTSVPVCNPSWQCTGKWKPEKCPKDEKQTQVCTDLNNCGTNAGKPAEERSCKYESEFTWITVIVVLTMFIMVIVIIIIYLTIKKQPKKHKDFLPSTPYTYNPKASSSQIPRHPSQIQYKHQGWY